MDLRKNGQAILRSNAILDNRENCSPDELLSIIDGYNALIVRGRTKVTRQVIEKGSRLKVIGRSGVGVDNIDLTAANDHDVVVVNAPISTSLAVAELALGLLFALARAIPQANQGMKNGQWVKKQLTGSELSGKTLGVVGMGNIGRLLAQRAAGLGMQVLGYDPLLDSDEIFRRGAQPRSLDEVIRPLRLYFIPCSTDSTNAWHGRFNCVSKDETRSPPGVHSAWGAAG